MKLKTFLSIATTTFIFSKPIHAGVISESFEEVADDPIWKVQHVNNSRACWFFGCYRNNNYLITGYSYKGREDKSWALGNYVGRAGPWSKQLSAQLRGGTVKSNPFTFLRENVNEYDIQAGFSEQVSFDVQNKGRNIGSPQVTVYSDTGAVLTYSEVDSVTPLEANWSRITLGLSNVTESVSTAANDVRIHFDLGGRGSNINNRLDTLIDNIDMSGETVYAHTSSTTHLSTGDGEFLIANGSGNVKNLIGSSDNQSYTTDLDNALDILASSDALGMLDRIDADGLAETIKFNNTATQLAFGTIAVGDGIIDLLSNRLADLLTKNPSGAFGLVDDFVDSIGDAYLTPEAVAMFYGAILTNEALVELNAYSEKLQKIRELQVSNQSIPTETVRQAIDHWVQAGIYAKESSAMLAFSVGNDGENNFWSRLADKAFSAGETVINSVLKNQDERYNKVKNLIAIAEDFDTLETVEAKAAAVDGFLQTIIDLAEISPTRNPFKQIEEGSVTYSTYADIAVENGIVTGMVSGNVDFVRNISIDDGVFQGGQGTGATQTFDGLIGTIVNASPAWLDLSIDTPLDSFFIDFEYNFGQFKHSFDINLNDTFLESFFADNFIDDMWFRGSIFVNDRQFFGLNDATLRFLSNSSTGNSVSFRDISLVNSITSQKEVVKNPEPSTWLMLLMGITGLLYIRKRAHN